MHGMTQHIQTNTQTPSSGYKGVSSENKPDSLFLQKHGKNVHRLSE